MNIGWLVSKIFVLSCWCSDSSGYMEFEGLLVLLYITELRAPEQKCLPLAYTWLCLRRQHRAFSQAAVRENLQLSLCASAIALVHEHQLMN